jgi:molybdopterin-containing oxidoreductase family iron-sulfur binding subunit
MQDGKSRREFLYAAGAVAVGVGVGGPILSALARGAGVATGKTGPRWAMVIDLQKCRHAEGCRDCIARCHEVHNVPDVRTSTGEVNAKEEVKWIWKEPFPNAFPDEESEYAAESQRGLSAIVFCNHCERPPCVRVCPTGATFKRDDGVVMMDMHRCIGCRYCIVGCPYGSRSFNWSDPRKHLTKPNADYPTRTKGVVEKCTLCDERLAKGQIPACVEACREKAIVFGDVRDSASEVRRILNSRYTIRRRPALGTQPHVFYVV